MDEFRKLSPPECTFGESSIKLSINSLEEAAIVPHAKDIFKLMGLDLINEDTVMALNPLKTPGNSALC